MVRKKDIKWIRGQTKTQMRQKLENNSQSKAGNKEEKEKRRGQKNE